VSCRPASAPGDAISVHVATGECFSARGGAWRRLAAGDTVTEAVLIAAGDARKRIAWVPEVVQATEWIFNAPA